MNPLFKISVSIKIIAVIISGICFYLGFSLSGDMGWLLWVAPVPIIYISLFVKPAQAFWLSFLAYLIGRLSWFPYFLKLIPAPLAIAFTLILPFIFAFIIIANRKIVLKSSHWFSALAYPVLFTAFEYLLFLFSKDGTAASIAYTQSNYLPVVQLAALTGILGISFLICFFASATTLALYFWKNKRYQSLLIFLIILVVGDVFFYGIIRLGKPEKGIPIQFGLVSLDESVYKGIYGSDPAIKMRVVDSYLQEISKLADQGAKVIVLPEKVIFVNDSTSGIILKKFADLALTKKIQIIIGGFKDQQGVKYNNAWVVSSEGILLADYQKVNLFEGEVLDGCKPGNKLAVFANNKMNEGVAICKDMDFQQYMLGYSKKSPVVMYVPAWDFVIDGWLHSRMAMMRSVEGGFPMARNARQGRLTLNDWRGKIIAEANGDSGAFTTLTGTLYLGTHPTVYAMGGDWLGTICVFGVFGFLIFSFKKENPSGKRQPPLRQ